MSAEIVVIATALLLRDDRCQPGSELRSGFRLAISGARQTAIGATIGLACAATLYSVLSMSGLAMLRTQMGWLAGAAQIAGGLFLIYFGIKGWLHRPAPDDAQGSFARVLRLGLRFTGTILVSFGVRLIFERRT